MRYLFLVLSGNPGNPLDAAGGAADAGRLHAVFAFGAGVPEIPPGPGVLVPLPSMRSPGLAFGYPSSETASPPYAIPPSDEQCFGGALTCTFQNYDIQNSTPFVVDQSEPDPQMRTPFISFHRHGAFTAGYNSMVIPPLASLQAAVPGAQSDQWEVVLYWVGLITQALLFTKLIMDTFSRNVNIRPVNAQWAHPELGAAFNMATGSDTGAGVNPVDDPDHQEFTQFQCRVNFTRIDPTKNALLVFGDPTLSVIPRLPRPSSSQANPCCGSVEIRQMPPGYEPSYLSPIGSALGLPYPFVNPP